MSDSPKAVFLSYAHEDAALAQRLAEALRAAGVVVWFDQSELRGGDAWDAKIKKQIRECALFLPVISAHTNARAEGYFRLEWKLAVDRSHLMADDAPFIMPVVLDDTADASARVPDKFREVQWTRLTATAQALPAFAQRVQVLLGRGPEPGPTMGEIGAGLAGGFGGGGRTRQTVPISPTEPEAAPGWRPAPGHLVPGTQWQLEEKLGEGGFGEVWLGRHQTMKERRVFKFCFSAERVRALKREMTLFRVLKERVGGHPNIVRLLEVHFNEPPFYLEMDYVEGQSLKIWCEHQGGVDKIPLAVRLEMVAQIADALHAAHAADVIHRDVKPGNILIAQAAAPHVQPTAMLSDFGIGQVLSEEALAGMTKAGFTKSIEAGSSSPQSGTQLYMAPELLAGEPASARSDLYSLGVVLFQLVVGDLHRPLTTDWPRAIDDPLLREDLARCFAGRLEERFASGSELAASLRSMEQRRAALKAQQAAAAARQRVRRRWRILGAVGVAVLVVGLGANLVWFLQRNAKLRWARETALPEITKLIGLEEFSAAFALAREAEKYLPNDPALTSLWPKISVRATIETTPPGAEIYLKSYRKPDAAWQFLGRTPLKDIRVARDFYRWKIRKEGYAPLERASGIGNDPIRITLEAPDVSVPGMVRVSGGGASLFNLNGLQHRPTVQVGSYLVDRYEVSNRQFKDFVDRGGYSTVGFWKHPFIKLEKEFTWPEAMAEFRDATGQPGPATWKSGTYPDDQADFPVTGVSWFEAAAYAESVGKRLPSFYHWSRAASLGNADVIVPLSNFGGHGPARVGTYQGMSPAGAYDMAGNAKEWCWNEAGPDKRYILGGAWREPVYMFVVTDAMSPFDRAPTNGFRCIKLLSAQPLPAGVDDSVAPLSRNYANEKPVNDETFRIYKSLFSYDKTDLDSRVDAVDESSGSWRREKVSFNAAYGNERVMAHLFLPKKFAPPYQAVVFFPGAFAINRRSSDALIEMERFTYFIENGRALIYPIYKGTYERGDDLRTYRATPTSLYRDHVIQWSKDLGRAIDYLETRQDIRADKLAYAGTSWGASMGALLPALENRLKANVLIIGGFHIQTTLPEVDQLNFAPRITIPTLMLNGRFDAIFPLESSQRPLFRWLGTPPEHKRHMLFDSGHSVPVGQIAKEANEWLDRYLGPVK